ncbi:hypothetical protein [Pseudoxanthomonas mexicana]|uniref:hypothetical protein n=1 Tax=Pseudoxanthomonas mexicana TaxID=128785 RepID=UPI0022F3FBA3|nr:hypothetical protein [Pseudoxanthomonas mexicana]WBX94967.1 hypothetical protein PE064_07210 [Pseudoxanthomonas mexicana]
MSNLLQAPQNAGRLIVESAAVLACPLLDTEKFVRFCRDRDLSIDRARLLRLERLGLFAPVFRVRAPGTRGQSFHIPVREGNNWFDKGWAWDTTRIPVEHEIPSDRITTQQGYYSIFQVDWLRLVLNEMTLHVQMDAYLAEPISKASRSDQGISRWVERFKEVQEGSSTHTYRPSIALLCQYISNRYYPQAVGDQRTIRTGSGTSWDRWLTVGDRSWTWENYVRDWDPGLVAIHFGLTPEKLKHAYRTLSNSQSFMDPIANWYPLVQFVSLDKRRKLKGAALQAETLREGALMLRGLHFDLYHEKLPAPGEINTTVIVPMPELEVRKDVRMHLEYVVNQYGLNPQPKLVLFVEGQSEERVVHRLLEEYFGILPGRLSIEVVTVRGVDNATGTSEDRFRAILRLVDYLHHHQTFAFVVLDNENFASKLKRESATTRSTYGHRKRITRPEYIHVWKSAFELDNFSNSELARALIRVSGERYRFTAAEIVSCRAAKNPGAALSKLYREATQFGLPKLQLADALVDTLLSDRSRRRAENRPIIKVLVRALKLAALNHLPTRQEAWTMNQASRLLARKT